MSTTAEIMNLRHWVHRMSCHDYHVKNCAALFQYVAALDTENLVPPSASWYTMLFKQSLWAAYSHDAMSWEANGKEIVLLRSLLSLTNSSARYSTNTMNARQQPRDVTELRRKVLGGALSGEYINCCYSNVKTLKVEHDSMYTWFSTTLV